MPERPSSRPVVRLYRAALIALVSLSVACGDEGPTVIETGSVLGTVTVEDDGLGSVTITLEGGATPRTTQTNGNGQFSFTAVPTGAYTVSLTNPDDEVYAFVTSTRSVTVSANGSADASFTGTVLRTAMLSGTVRIDGTGLADVEVQIDGPEGDTQTTTDGAGAFAFANLRAGEYTVTVTNPNPNAYNLPETSWTTTLAGGGSASHDFEGAALPPVIALASNALAFSDLTAGTNPPAQGVAVTNGGGGSLGILSASVEYEAGEPEGWLSATLTDDAAPTTLTVQPTTGALQAGTYTARIIVDSDGPAEAQEIAVTFVVDSRPTFGYAWAYDATPAGPYNARTGAPRYSYNSAGGAIMIERTAIGLYQVTFENMGDGLGVAETVLVSPYGGTAALCGVQNWGQGDDLVANVYCRDPSGAALMDSPFVVLVVGQDALEGRSGFAWSSSVQATYEPNPYYAWNSAGAPMSFTLNADYRTVDLGVVHDENSSVAYLTTPYASAPGSCSTSIVNYPVSSVDVACRTAAADVFQDYRFQALMLQNGRPGMRSAFTLGYLTDQDPVGQVAVLTHNSTGGAVTIDKLGTGYYVVTFEGQATPPGGSEVVMVSPFGNQYATCNSETWVDAGADLRAWVRCVDATGAAKDHQFWVVLLQ